MPAEIPCWPHWDLMDGLSNSDYSRAVQAQDPAWGGPRSCSPMYAQKKRQKGGLHPHPFPAWRRRMPSRTSSATVLLRCRRRDPPY